jgi:hypothetical protein
MKQKIEEKLGEWSGIPRPGKQNTVRNVLLIAVVLVLIAALLLVRDARITGYHSLQTFESDVFVAGASEDLSLSFERIPNLVAKAGEETSFKVRANRKDVIFREDTNLFDITEEGVVEFTPSAEDIGRHNVWVIIKDSAGKYYYQNVVIIVEE